MKTFNVVNVQRDGTLASSSSPVWMSSVSLWTSFSSFSHLGENINELDRSKHAQY